MRKSLLTLGLASLALTSFGATRVLYQQNFETVSTPEEAGWSYGGTSMTIASDAFGKYLELSQGQTNGRSAQVTWGQGIFLDKNGESVLEEDGKYTVEYDFAIIKGSNNQYNSEFTIFTNHAPIENNKYFLPWSQKVGNRCWENWLFDMNCNEADSNPLQFYVDASAIETEVDVEDTEKDEEGKDVVVGSHKELTYSLDTDNAELASFTEGAWYTVTLEVNVNDRTVEYSIVSLDGTEIAASGTHNVPENDVNGDPISMYAEGLYILVARYQTIYDIDNIRVYFESSKEVANDPTIALTRVGKTVNEDDEQIENLNVRAYTITFIDGEVLHVTGTDGKTIEVDYADCDGAYVYETTTSGVLKAWTTRGDATSEVIETEVDCDPIVLPAVAAAITSVSDGYVKTYTLSVSNADVPLRPDIFISYEFKGKDGEIIAAEDQASGVKIPVTQEGTLTLTSSAFGYQETTVTIENNTEFAQTKIWDFARMNDDELKEAGFASWENLNSATTSGFNNWTARKRLYYNLAGSEHENDEGAIVYDTVLPFGFISEENTTNVLPYSVVSAADRDHSTFFDGLVLFDDNMNVGMLKHVGLYNDATTNNNNIVKIKNVGANDFVLVNRISDYGSNSSHPVCATDEEYFAQLTGADDVLVARNIVVDPANIPNYKGSKENNYGSHALLNEDGTYDVCCSLYRIDTALTKIVIFSQVGGPIDDAVEGIEAIQGDGFWYSIDGVRVAEPTRPGLYIHNGKKIIVK